MGYGILRLVSLLAYAYYRVSCWYSHRLCGSSAEAARTMNVSYDRSSTLCPSRYNFKFEQGMVFYEGGDVVIPSE